MAFYGWTEEYEQILDQCLPRRSPNCCIYHNDQIDRSSVEEIAKVLGEDNTEDGVVVSSILGAACTCEDYEFSSPYDLVTLHRTNMPYEDLQKEDDEMVLYYTNVCNRLKDKKGNKDICDFLEALIVQWNTWKDPTVVNIFRVLNKIIFKPYKDTFALHIMPNLWKDFFSEQLRENLKEYDCDVCLHTDEDLALNNRVYFVIQAPSFQHYLRLKDYLMSYLQRVQDDAMGPPETEDDDEQEEIGFLWDTQENSESENETSQDNLKSDSEINDCPTSTDPLTNDEHTPTHSQSNDLSNDSNSPDQDNAQMSDSSQSKSENTQFGNVINIGDILVPQIPELQSPKSPPGQLTFGDFSGVSLYS